MAAFLLVTVAEFTTTGEPWAKKWELIEVTSDTYPKYIEIRPGNPKPKRLRSLSLRDGGPHKEFHHE
jgi:hypothetical protein